MAAATRHGAPQVDPPPPPPKPRLETAALEENVFDNVPFTPSNGICTPTPTGAPIHQPPWQADMGAHMPPGWAVPPPFAPPPPYPGGVYPFQAGGPLHAGVFPPVVFVPPPPPPPLPGKPKQRGEPSRKPQQAGAKKSAPRRAVVTPMLNQIAEGGAQRQRQGGRDQEEAANGMALLSLESSPGSSHTTSPAKSERSSRTTPGSAEWMEAEFPPLGGGAGGESKPPSGASSAGPVWPGAPASARAAAPAASPPVAGRPAAARMPPTATPELGQQPARAAGSDEQQATPAPAPQQRSAAASERLVAGGVEYSWPVPG
eukprot:jgi/Tetstr1/442215/TSEL_030362.t1